MSRHFFLKRVLPASLAFAILPLAAQAGDLSYNYVQAGYDYTNGHNSNNSHGWEGTASAGLGQHFQIFGDGRITDAQTRTGQGYGIGGGFHTPVAGNTDFVGDVAYHHANFDGVSGDIKTYSGEVGVRSALATHFEGWVMAGYAHGDNQLNDIPHDSKNAAYGKLGAQFKFDKNWGLVAEGKVSSDDRSIFVGPRFSF